MSGERMVCEEYDGHDFTAYYNPPQFNYARRAWHKFSQFFAFAMLFEVGFSVLEE